MTIATDGPVIIGAGEEAATVVFLFLVGESLEGVAAGRARDSICRRRSPSSGRGLLLASLLRLPGNSRIPTQDALR
jgi:hypothetical protein